MGDCPLPGKGAEQHRGSGAGRGGISNASATGLGEDVSGRTAGSGGQTQEELDGYDARESDRLLPIANISRIMKAALPENAKIAKEAKECVQECVSEFIGFITSEASEKCLQEKRKTVNGEDVLFAMMSLGFENYAEVLKIYLTKYREMNKMTADKVTESNRSYSQNQELQTETDQSQEYNNLNSGPSFDSNYESNY